MAGLLCALEWLMVSRWLVRPKCCCGAAVADAFVGPAALLPALVGVGVVQPRAESMLFSREWDGGWKKDLGNLRMLSGMERIFFSPGFSTLSNSACRLSSESCSMRIIVVLGFCWGAATAGWWSVELLTDDAGDIGLIGLDRPWLLPLLVAMSCYF